MYNGFHKNNGQHNFFQHTNNDKNASWATNQHIRMISEESCDTKDWMTVEKYFKWHFKIY